MEGHPHHLQLSVDGWWNLQKYLCPTSARVTCNHHVQLFTRVLRIQTQVLLLAQ